MNEQDLKRAFEDVVVASSPPPSMDPGRALDAARRARSRRRSSIVGALVAVLVVGVGLGSAFALNPKAAKDYLTGAGPSSSSSWPGEWPDGQTDRTARNGLQADRANKLLEELKGVVPAGYDAPRLGDLQRTWAQVASDRGEAPEIWEYTAETPVRKDGKVGRLLVESSAPNPKMPQEPCELARTFWGMGGECQVYEIKGLRVGVVRSNTSGRGQFDKWATYRSQDGQIVTIAQDDNYLGGGCPELEVPLFPEQRLAELATDPRFRVGG
jgi:hypothetical protein